MTLVVIARYDDLPAARMAESFLRDAGLEPSVADGVLTSVDPLLMRALGGIRLSVPTQHEAEARDLLARVEAGEFATPLEDDDRLEPGRRLGSAVTLLSVMAEPSAGYASLKRSQGGWVSRIGRGLVLLIALGMLATIGLAALVWLGALFG